MESDTDAALEWADWKQSLCSGCGRPRDETMDSANEDAFDAVAMRCFACEARDRQQHQWSRDRNADTSGLYFAVVDDTDR